MPLLLHITSDSSGQKHQISGDGLTIGRSIKNSIYLDDPSASQVHARIDVKELKDGSLIYFLTDLESTNHTYVNQHPVKEHLLSDQDFIEIGVNHFRYIDEDKESLAATKQFKKSWIPGILVLKD
jgi:pSer/pThr/pTyr-binding forkhead associated (FHA) protein